MVAAHKHDKAQARIDRIAISRAQANPKLIDDEGREEGNSWPSCGKAQRYASPNAPRLTPLHIPFARFDQMVSALLGAAEGNDGIDEPIAEVADRVFISPSSLGFTYRI